MVKRKRIRKYTKSKEIYYQFWPNVNYSTLLHLPPPQISLFWRMPRFEPRPVG
jgi:hypothetical protein